VGCLLALPGVAAAAAVRVAGLHHLGDLSPFLTYYLVVVLVSLYGGFLPGAFATALAALAASYWMAPFSTPGVDTTTDLTRQLLFIVSGFGIAAACEYRYGAYHSSRHARQLLAAQAELRRREADAQARAAELQAILDAVPALVFISRDRQCRTMATSRAARDLLRPNDADLKLEPHCPAEFVPSFKVLRGGREVPREELPMEVAAATGRPVRDSELTLIFNDGRVREFFGDAVPLLSATGEVYGAVAAFLDITGRKLAEDALRDSQARLRLFIEHAPAALAMFDRNMRYLAASRRWYVDFGLGEVDIRGCCHYEVFPEIPQRWKEIHRRCLAGETLRADEDEFIRTDGSRQWLKWEILPWRSDNDIGGIIMFVEEITQRKETEERLRAATAAAEEASSAKDQFLAVLSHELRTPLTPALTTVSMLLGDARMDGFTREMLEVVRRNCELEALLIDDLLDVTRITRGKLQLTRRPVDLKLILSAALDVCRPDIQTRRLRVDLSLCPEPCIASGDPLRLQQVFWNLLKNATKFSEADAPLVVSLQRDDGQAIITVRDHGVGIDPAMLPRIFEPFEQGSAGTTRQFGGLGLGLTISRAMVELHGGQIEASSEGKGKGSTFTVRLPLIDTPVAAAPPQAPRPFERKLRILLVEDHGDTARIVARLLSRKGHSVTIAGDVASALRSLGEHEFDLLVSDLGLPDGSGVDLMQELRRRGSHLPGIALSGYGQDQDIQRSRDAGFAIHLTKPASPEAIEASIASVFTSRQQ
jgi:PAS domain S-box-containing protein